MLQEQLKKFSKLLDALREQGLIAGFALIGGLAVSTWSRPRATRNVNLLMLVKPADIPRFVAALQNAGIHAVVHKGGPDDPVPCLIRVGNLDIIAATRKLEAEAVASSIAVEIAGMKIPVVAPEYLVILKLKAGGPQDVIDVRELLASTGIDTAKVRELAARFRVSRLLERLIS
jgi:hypothetical protein